MAKIPLRDRIRELERVYSGIGKQLKEELLKIGAGNYQELEAMKVKEKAEKLIKRLNREAIRWANGSITEAYKESYIISKTRLELLGISQTLNFDRKKHRRTVEDIRGKTIDDLLKANLSIKQNVDTYLYLMRTASQGVMQIQEFGLDDEEAIEGIIAAAIKEGKRPGYAINLIRAYFQGKIGDGQLIKAGSRTYDLKYYSRMVARTRMRKVQTEAVKNTCEQYGNDLVQVSDHSTECEICEPYEGEVFSLSGRHPEYPQLDESPPWHPNCMHNILPTSEEAIEVSKRWQ